MFPTIKSWYALKPISIHFLSHIFICFSNNITCIVSNKSVYIFTCVKNKAIFLHVTQVKNLFQF